MNNQKLSRLLSPNLQLYFICLVIFTLATIPVSPMLAAAEGAATLALYAVFIQGAKKRRQSVLQYIDNVTGNVDTASKSTLINSPLPIMVFRPDTGEVIWSNENFIQLAGVREHLFEMRVEDAAPDFPIQWILEGKRECPERVSMNSRCFQVYGSLARAKGRSGEQNLVATTYWVDTTETDRLRETHEATKPVVAILMVDNYEETMNACGDAQRSAILAKIDERLNDWASAANGLLIKTERDHYLFIFEEQYFAHFVEEKFSILDAIRDIKAGEGGHPTLSIGVGREAGSIPELYKYAGLSLEMALSRGGDQAGEQQRFSVLRRQNQNHRKTHQGQVPGHGERVGRVDFRYREYLYHGPQLRRYGCCRGGCRRLLRGPETWPSGADHHRPGEERRESRAGDGAGPAGVSRLLCAPCGSLY